MPKHSAPLHDVLAIVQTRADDSSRSVKTSPKRREITIVGRLPSNHSAPLACRPLACHRVPLACQNRTNPALALTYANGGWCQLRVPTRRPRLLLPYKQSSTSQKHGSRSMSSRFAVSSGVSGSSARPAALHASLGLAAGAEGVDLGSCRGTRTCDL